jgi:hypothetical protein
MSATCAGLRAASAGSAVASGGGGRRCSSAASWRGSSALCLSSANTSASLPSISGNSEQRWKHLRVFVATTPARLKACARPASDCLRRMCAETRQHTSAISTVDAAYPHMSCITACIPSKDTMQRRLGCQLCCHSRTQCKAVPGTPCT